MTRSEHEHLVERYLSGRMSPADEQEFFIQVAVDSNLRQTLKAYRVVESAMQKHRDSLPAQHLASRAKLISRLEGARAGESAMETGGRALTGSGAAGMGVRWSMAAVAAAALTVGALVIGPLINRDAAPRVATPASSGASAPAMTRPSAPTMPRQNAPVEHHATASDAATSGAVETIAPDAVRGAAQSSAESRAAGEHAMPRERHRSPVEEAGTRAASRRASSPASVETSNGAATSVSEGSTEPQEWVSTKHTRTAKPRYTSQDTIRIPVQINLPNSPK